MRAKKTGLIVLFLGVGLAGSGCASLSEEVTYDGSFALARVEPTQPAEPATSGEFHLGAGDALGLQVFTRYVAIVRASGARQFAGAPEIPQIAE